MSYHVPKGPSELCDLLRMGYSERQRDLMDRVASARGTVDARLEDPDWAEDPLRAAVMGVLWRVLTVPGTRATLIAPSEEGSTRCAELGVRAMSFLAEVCVTRDVCLRSVCSVRQWNRVEFVGEAGWEVRLTPNVPEMVAEAARRSLIGVVLDAGSSQPAFVEAQKALEGVLKDPRAGLIRLW